MSAPPASGSSRSTAPVMMTTTNRSSPPACPSAPAKTPSTPPAASTSTTPPPGPEPPTNLRARPLSHHHRGQPIPAAADPAPGTAAGPRRIVSLHMVLLLIVAVGALSGFYLLLSVVPLYAAAAGPAVWALAWPPAR